MKPLGVSRESKNGYGRQRAKIFAYSMLRTLVVEPPGETMLGNEFAGVLSSDDFSVYNGVIVGAQQKCLAHLRRHFKKVLLLSHGNNTVVASAFLELIDEVFRQHRKWREHAEEIDYHTWAKEFKVRLAELLNTWQGHVGHAAGLLLRSLQNKAHQWWYFLDHPEIPPDNNASGTFSAISCD